MVITLGDDKEGPCQLVMQSSENILNEIGKPIMEALEAKGGIHLKASHAYFYYCLYLYRGEYSKDLTSRLTKGQRKPPIEVSISGKSMVGFEGLLVHNNF